MRTSFGTGGKAHGALAMADQLAIAPGASSPIG